jgi:hypothetical protein
MKLGYLCTCANAPSRWYRQPQGTLWWWKQGCASTFAEAPVAFARTVTQLCIWPHHCLFNISFIMKQIIKIGLKDLKPTDLIARCRTVEAKMDGNPLFPNPVPSIAELTAAREELEHRTVAARHRDLKAVALRRTQEAVVVDHLRRLAAYVQSLAQRPEDVLSAGFQLRRQPTSIAALDRPLGLEARRTDKTGIVSLNWTPVKRTRQYRVEMTSNDPAGASPDWISVGYTSRSRFEVDKLIPGTYYWFRVVALGTVGSSPFSDPAIVMAA